VIRNVVVHVSNEQPLLADLFDVPGATDVGLLCTNMRLMDGKRPVFIDSSESTFFFPYRAIRFLEIPVGAIDRHRAEGGRAPGSARGGTPADASMPGGETSLPAVIEVAAGDEGTGLDMGDEIDEDFLRRIRDA
jgi:hypothetical protein